MIPRERAGAQPRPAGVRQAATPSTRSARSGRGAQAPNARERSGALGPRERPSQAGCRCPADQEKTRFSAPPYRDAPAHPPGAVQARRAGPYTERERKPSRGAHLPLQRGRLTASAKAMAVRRSFMRRRKAATTLEWTRGAPTARASSTPRRRPRAAGPSPGWPPRTRSSPSRRARSGGSPGTGPSCP